MLKGHPGCRMCFGQYLVQLAIYMYMIVYVYMYVYSTANDRTFTTK